MSSNHIFQGSLKFEYDVGWFVSRLIFLLSGKRMVSGYPPCQTTPLAPFIVQNLGTRRYTKSSLVNTAPTPHVPPSPTTKSSYTVYLPMLCIAIYS